MHGTRRAGSSARVVEAPLATVATMEPIETIYVLEYVGVLFRSVLSLEISVQGWLSFEVVNNGSWIALYRNALCAECDSFLRCHSFFYRVPNCILGSCVKDSVKGFKILALFTLAHAFDGAV
jgi:hypothetical protein